MNWYVEVLKKYVVFSGRARRQEFWMFALFNLIALVVLFILGMIIGSQVLYYIYALGVFLPGLGVSFRRLHDTGRSAVWLLFVLIPFVGFIVPLVLCCLDSQPGANEYGPNPKEFPAQA
ncbi:DUF805 domain-containing protein [Streptomyces sp. MS06]|uniref:DUF805 domain-containing protein n=1 Tax=Streptomyces sp. MS06 TaxID=3385974 RepID=UPI0039A3CC60